MLLYGQLQEGMLYTLMESPAVSGVQDFKELCLAATREERRLAELKKRQKYLKAEKIQISKTEKTGAQQQRQLRCYICDSPNHLARQCP